VLVLAGELDIVTKPEASTTIASQARARLENIEGVNHMGMLEQSSVYNSAIAGFLGQVFTPAKAEIPTGI
jgi:pimeloyl-ACP methyl ester carboxylesterase